MIVIAFSRFCSKSAIISIVVAISMTAWAPSTASARQQVDRPLGAPTADKPPLALKQLSEGAVGVFDAVRRGDWRTADSEWAGMPQAILNLPSELAYPEVAWQLRQRVRALGRALRARRVVASLDDANATTRLVTEISDGYEGNVPFEIAMLSYYGRQLELGIAINQMPVLKTAAVDLSSTWHRIEPIVLERGDTADARSLTDILVQLDRARRPADFAEAAKAELAVASRLRQVFEAGS